ncbi:MAG: DUF4350 domain-containing protein [Thermofilum sp.]
MRSILLASAALALGVVMLVAWLYPVNADFWPANPGWNGLQELARSRGALEAPLTELAALDPRNYTLLIVGPSKSFTPGEVLAVRAFLAKGGRVVIADDFGTANELLEAIGAPVRLTGGLLVDPLLNLGARELPLAYWSGRRLALNYATALNVTGCAGCRVLAASSFFSYLDLDGNGVHDEGEPAGPLPTAVSLSFRGGELVVVSDSSIFINSMLGREGNALFLEHLLRSTAPAIDNSHWEETPLVALKAALSSAHRALSSPELKYPLAAAAPLGVVAMRRQRELAERLKRHVVQVARAVEVQGE